MNKDENLNTTVLKHHVQLYLLWDEAGCPRLWNKHVPDTTGQLAAAPGKGNPAPWQSQAAPKWKIRFLVSFQSGQHRKTQHSLWKKYAKVTTQNCNQSVTLGHALTSHTPNSDLPQRKVAKRGVIAILPGSTKRPISRTIQCHGRLMIDAWMDRNFC